MPEIDKDKKNIIINKINEVKKVSDNSVSISSSNKSEPISRYWYIKGQAYDLDPWLPNHPGGSTILEMCRGSDVTALFVSCHLTPPTDEFRSKFLVEDKNNEDLQNFGEEGMKKLRGNLQPYTQPAAEYIKFRADVYEYLKKKKLNIKADFSELMGALVMVISYFVLLYFALSTGNIFLGIIFGFSRALLSLTIGHPMSHFQIFKGEKNMWFFKNFSAFVLSASSVWVPSHVISHHVETYVAEDLQDNYPLKRLHKSLPGYFFHKYQHIYVWFVYAIALPLWSLQDLVDTTIAIVTNGPMKRYYHASLGIKLHTFFTLLFNLVFLYIIPFKNFGLLFSLAHTIPASLWVVLSIMVNHEVDIHEFDQSKLYNWTDFQILKSHNFGARSRLACFLTGGLNLQIEHHLFPGLFFFRLYEIQHLVREYCVKNKLPYNESNTIFGACQKHYNLLKQTAALD
jgi:fatty acid desaturase